MAETSYFLEKLYGVSTLKELNEVIMEFNEVRDKFVPLDIVEIDRVIDDTFRRVMSLYQR